MCQYHEDRVSVTGSNDAPMCAECVTACIYCNEQSMPEDCTRDQDETRTRLTGISMCSHAVASYDAYWGSKEVREWERLNAKYQW